MNDEQLMRLKARWYDLLVTKEQLERQMRELSQKIQQLEQIRRESEERP